MSQNKSYIVALYIQVEAPSAEKAKEIAMGYEPIQLNLLTSSIREVHTKPADQSQASYNSDLVWNIKSKAKI